MQIVRLEAENIKKLVAVEITPAGNVVVISGKNGAGKTSVLDAIFWALAGTGNIQKQPIRTGQTKARIKLDLGELIVERRFTAESGTTQLIVENAQGARFPSPQRMLDALLGELAFDPLEFSRMEPRQQFDALRRISKLDVDIDALDGLNRRDYETRTDINRQAKKLQAQADAIVVGPLPDEPVSVEAIFDELKTAGEKNTELEQRRAWRVHAEQDIDRETRSIATHKERIEQLEKLIAEQRNLISQSHDNILTFRRALESAPPLPEPVDLEPIRAQLEKAQLTNKHIAKRDEKQRIAAEAAELVKKSADLTKQMSDREAQKAAAIQAAQMPVDGLGFGAGSVTFNGLPFEQASSAEQLRVSLAIAMAANPKLRVIRIQDGSLLDDDSMQEIARLAVGHDYQIWVERVDTTGKVGIVIDDGTVAAVNASSAE